MEIFIWVLSVILISLVLGELYYRYLKRKKYENNKKINNVSSSAESSIDIPMEKLAVESTEIVSRNKIQMRGSWRLAKDKVLPMRSFEHSRDNEYKKML